MKTLLAFLAFTVLLFTVGRADEVSDAKQRIQSRQGEVAALKDKGVLGENNRGYLEVRGSDAAGAGSIASEENRDRETLYSVVAKRTGSTTDVVARARAKEIAQSSRSGVWVQEESGNWTKK